jgi:predicted nucleic acid-binding protein
MKIVLDTNIVFSAILNTQSRIGQLIINGSRYFDFYTVELLRAEIINHKAKILQISRFDENQFSEIFQMLSSRIKFINDILIADDEFEIANTLVSNIDENDTLFVALTNHLSATLWTGDKKLITGLQKKNYQALITTDELYRIFLDKQS